MTPARSAFRLRPSCGVSPAGLARAGGTGLGMIGAAVVGVAGLYLVKSALGINIFPGHSPFLHAAIYALVWG